MWSRLTWEMVHPCWCVVHSAIPTTKNSLNKASSFFLAIIASTNWITPVFTLEFRKRCSRIQSNDANRKMAVLSNKPVNPSRAIVDALGLAEFFVNVYGGNSFETKKPDPQGVKTLLKETGTGPANAIIVGDSSIDVLTGRNAEIATCGVTYGFAPHTLCEAPPDILIESPQELGELFL